MWLLITSKIHSRCVVKIRFLLGEIRMSLAFIIIMINHDIDFWDNSFYESFCFNFSILDYIILYYSLFLYLLWNNWSFFWSFWYLTLVLDFSFIWLLSLIFPPNLSKFKNPLNPLKIFINFIIYNNNHYVYIFHDINNFLTRNSYPSN